MLKDRPPTGVVLMAADRALCFYWHNLMPAGQLVLLTVHAFCRFESAQAFYLRGAMVLLLSLPFMSFVALVAVLVACRLGCLLFDTCVWLGRRAVRFWSGL